MIAVKRDLALIADFGCAVVSLFAIYLLAFYQNHLVFCHQQSSEKGSYLQQFLLNGKKYIIKELSRITVNFDSRSTLDIRF